MISKTLKQAKITTFQFLVNTIILVLLLAGMLFTSPSALSAENTKSTITDPSSLTWKPLEGIPEGAEVAVLSGNPATGSSEVIIRLPAGYLFPPSLSY